MRKIKVTTYSLFLILFSLSIIAPFYGIAAEPEDFSLDITTTEDEPFGMAVLNIEGSMLSTLQVKSTVPSVIGIQDYLGNNIEEQTVPDSPDADLFYPVNMQLEQAWNYDTLNEYFNNYVYVENNSMDYGNETFTLTSTTVQYPLSTGESIEIYVSDIVSEIDLDVSQVGIYQIWLNEIGINDITILSPTNKDVNYRIDELPPIAFGSSISMGQYFFFAAFETGVYKIFIETADPIIRAEAEFRKPTRIRPGEFLSAGGEGFFDPTYTMDVYALSVDDLANYYKYIFNLDYGTPIIRTFHETPYSSNLYSMATGFNKILPVMTAETIYIVVDNPNYMYWPYAGISATFPIKYQMKFEEIEPTTHTVGSNETIAITKEEGVQTRSLTIVENTSLLSLHCENMGANSPDVYENSIFSSYLVKVSGENILSPQIQDVLYSGVKGEFITYLVEPGTYVIGFQHSGSLGTEFLNFTSAIRPLHDYLTVDWDKSSSDTFIPASSFQDVTLESWAAFPDDTGASYGTGLEYLIDESFWNHGFNITLDVSKNGDIFDQSITPDLGYLWDDSNNEYTDYTTEIQPGNAQAVPFKTNGTTNGDAFYIGAYDKFSAVTLNIQGPPTDMDEFVWQYLGDEDTWITFDAGDAFVDGTNAGTGSLNQSGTVSWNPELLWRWYHYSADYNDTSPEIPETRDRDLYLVRCRSTDSDALIPNITSASLTKFVEIEFDLNSQLGFDVGDLEDPVFYEIDTRNWNGEEINNVDVPKSILDSNNDIPYNFINRTAILFLSGDNLVVRDYNGSNNGIDLKFNGSLTFSVAVYKPINNLFIRNYSIGANIPTVHSSDRNLTQLPSDYTFSLGLDVVSDILLEITPRTVFDWTQIDVQVINGTVLSSSLIFPSAYDEYTVSYFAGTLNGGEISLGYTGSDVNFTHEFGCLSDLMYLRLRVQNTTDGPVFFKVYGGQFGYPQLMLDITDTAGLPEWATWTIIGVSAGVIAVTAGVLIYRKKHFLKIP
ncbi:MAG: hypothetical protein ACTSWW_04945 [Promethearchaeota archaeon]